MVIDNRCGSCDINEKIFWFKAKFDNDENSDSENDKTIMSTCVSKIDENKPNIFRLNYKDDNYELSMTTNDLDSIIIKTLCDHIESLKNCQPKMHQFDKSKCQ